MKNKIDQYKELLSVLPRNNIKNSRMFVRRAEEIKNEIRLYKNSIVTEIKRRYDKYLAVPMNDSINNLENNINDIKSNLYLLNDINTSYEKSGLDKILYDLGKFYNTDLEKVNEDILLTIDKFKLVGVILKKEDFDYGNYVSKYMSVFFDQIDNLKSSVLKETFDEIYWKCPDIIHYIKVNFRHLYFKNIKVFDKYYENRLNDLNINDKLWYCNEYKSKLRELNDLKNKDIRIIEDSFLSDKLDVKDYLGDKIDKLSNSMFSITLDTEELVRESRENLIKLSYTLNEYKQYLRFKYIFDSVKATYQEKANNKNIVKNTLKNINKYENKISKCNSKINFKKIFSKNESSFDKIFNDMGISLGELKKLYKEYDINYFKEKVGTYLNDNSSVLDCLHLASSYKINLIKIIQTNNEDITMEEVLKEINDLKEFVNSPSLNLVNNLTILDEKDLSMIIVDKYKLMDINISNEMLEDGNLDNFISNVDKILIAYYVNNCGITIDDISFMVDAKKIIEKNSN